MSIYPVLVLTFLNSISVRAARVILPLYALDLGAHPFAIGVLAATFSILPMFTSLPTGKLADRFGTRWPLIIGAIGGGFGMLVPFVLPGLPAVYIAAAMIGLSFAIYNVSLQNLIGLISNASSRTRNFSNYTLANTVSNFVGPVIAGFSIEHFGYADTCLYFALFTIVPVAMLASWGQRLPPGTLRVGTQHAKHALGSIRDLLSDPVVRRVLATGSLLHVGQDLFNFYMPVYMHTVGLAPSVIGIVLGMYSAAAFIVRLSIPMLVARFKEDKVLACAFFLSALSLMLVPFFTDAVILSFISFMFGLGMGVGQPIVMVLMFSSSAEGRSGEGMGLRMTVNHITKLAGPIAFGAIGSVFGLFPMFWVNALMMVGGGILSRGKIGS